jgi:ubiquinone/menaquinone biosynthesis C-methylase UbiE
MNIKNKSYWDNYYNSKKHNVNPSSFARFIAKKFIKKDSHILEVGSGDGRDTFFLRNKAKYILGVDLSKIVIKKNRLKSKRLGYKNINFKNLSSSHINKIHNKKIDFIYARFFIHSINEIKEDIFLKILSKKFKDKTLIAFEFRTIKDVLMKKGKKISKYERLTDHYRRFIDPKKFEKKLQNLKFKILYKKFGINLSKTGNENPHLCRIVFTKEDISKI